MKKLGSRKTTKLAQCPPAIQWQNSDFIILGPIKFFTLPCCSSKWTHVETHPSNDFLRLLGKKNECCPFVPLFHWSRNMRRLICRVLTAGSLTTWGQDIYLMGCFTRFLFSPPFPSDSLALGQVFAITLYFNQRRGRRNKDKNQNNKCNHLEEKAWREGWDYLWMAFSRVHCARCVWGKR